MRIVGVEYDFVRWKEQSERTKLTMGIYVEILIRSPMEEIWKHTQTPDVHQRWDLRFTEIRYLPRPDASKPQKFLYSTRIGFGLAINGEGETMGTSDSGHRTSALKFWSDDRISLIKEGSGYWKYIPSEKGIRFLTWYDYKARFGVLGKMIDGVIFRPLMGWATAWSFDRLRLWLEKGIHPALSLKCFLAYGISRATVAFVWIYHGLVPKLIYAHSDEMVMLVRSGIPMDHAVFLVKVAGWGEVLFGLLHLVFWKARRLFLLDIALMAIATIAVCFKSPEFLIATFNPVTLNLQLAALAGIGFLLGPDLPSASRCLRKMPEEKS